MASLDSHSCVHCCNKGKGQDPCVEKKDSVDCKFCISLTPEQCAQLATPSYKLKKEKHNTKKMEASASPSKDVDLIDPSALSVIGVVGNQGTVQSSVEPAEKKPEDKASTSKMKKTAESKSSTYSKIAELDQKYVGQI